MREILASGLKELGLTATEEQLAALEQFAGLLEEKYTTGKFGAITQDCIKAVQRQYGILETGIANLETRVALRKMAAQMRTAVPAP